MTLPSLIESGIAEFDNKFPIVPRTDYFGEIFTEYQQDLYVEIKAFLTSFATNVHNAAIESALRVLDEEVNTKGMSVEVEGQRILFIARAKLSALKEENV